MAAYLFDEAESDAIAQRFVGARLVAPALLGFELANVCVIKARRKPHERDALFAAFGKLHRLSVEEIRVELQDVVALAAETGLTAYDAAYLWLARHLDAELVTLDAQLARAASHAR